MSESPFAKLQSIAERSRAITIELPEKADEQAHWMGLGFNLLDQRFVVPMEEVSEMMRVPSTTRLPGVKSFVSGVGNVRGRLMAVLDLAAFFGESSSLPRAQRRVLAVEDEEQFFGFMIDESHGIQHFPSDAYESIAPELPERFRPFVRGSFKVAGVDWPVLSVFALLDHPELEKFAVAS